MNEQTRKAIAYASDFITFLILEGKIADKIITIYLFGSAVRGELTEDSDIDLFVNCKKEDENNVARALKTSEKNFRRSNDFDKWKALNFRYPLSSKVGPIDEWEIKESIEADGIQLFAREVLHDNLERVVLFVMDLPKNKKSYLALVRLLFGRNETGYKKNGLVDKNGIKLGSNTFIVPKSEQNSVISVLHKNKISFKMFELLRKSERL